MLTSWASETCRVVRVGQMSFRGPVLRLALAGTTCLPGFCSRSLKPPSDGNALVRLPRSGTPAVSMTKLDIPLPFYFSCPPWAALPFFGSDSSHV